MPVDTNPAKKKRKVASKNTSTPEQCLQSLKDIQCSLKDLDKHVPAIVTRLNTLQKKMQIRRENAMAGNDKDKNEPVEWLEQARIHATLACTVNSLFYLYLRCQGVDVSSHPVCEELQRAQSMHSKVLKECKLAQPNSATDGLGGRGPEPSTTIDVDAAARFIKGGLGGQTGTVIGDGDSDAGSKSGNDNDKDTDEELKKNKRRKKDKKKNSKNFKNKSKSN